MSMAQIKLGNLLWRPHTRPISPQDPVDVKDINTADIKAKLETVQSELARVKAELQEIKANQLSGDQKVTLKDASGAVVSPATEATLEQVRALLSGVATEAKLEQARTLLDAISGKVATEITLGQAVQKLTDLLARLENALTVQGSVGVTGDVDVSDNAERELGKVTLKGSNLALRQTIVTGAKTVTSTAAEIFAGASRLNNRHAMVVTNTGADIVYIGASDVTTSNGFPLFSQDTLRIEFDPTSSVGVFACTSGPNVQVRVVELA